MTDPTGLWGWNPIENIEQAANDVGELPSDFVRGWNSMTTRQKAADLALPAVALAGLGCAVLEPCGAMVLDKTQAIQDWLSETGACTGELGAVGDSSYELGGEASAYDDDELAHLIFQHVGEGDVDGKPSLDQIVQTLQKGRVTSLENSRVQLDYSGVRVIINEAMPIRSTAFYR